MGLRTGIFACKHTAFAIWSGFLTLLLGLVVFSTTYSGDYDVTGVVGGDNAGPGLRALLHGSLSGYIDHQPVVGLTSILLRLPVMAVGAAFGAGNLLNYQIGAVVCTIPLALLAAWLMTRPDISSRQRLMTLLAA